MLKGYTPADPQFWEVFKFPPPPSSIPSGVSRSLYCKLKLRVIVGVGVNLNAPKK